MSDKSHREITVKFRTTPEEYELIREKSELAGIQNLSAYIRKMAIDGYIVKLELPELREMISLLRRSSGNLNQIARRVNSTNRIYAEDMEDMMRQQQELWLCANKILKRLASLG
jgi:hypothetical protein